MFEVGPKKLVLYERVPRNKSYLRGEAVIEENEFLTRGPVLLCVSAQDDPKSAFGITKFGMNVVGIQVRDFNPQGYNLDGFPAMFCSIAKELSKEDGKSTDEEIFQLFYDEYLKCVIEENSHKRNPEEVAKNLRNLNIIGYCDGNVRIEKIIQTLKSNMDRVGYSKGEIDFAISQIGLVTLATERDTSKIGCTVVDFHELKDQEVSSRNIHQETVDILKRTGWNEGLLIIDERRAEHILVHSDEHNMKHFFNDGTATPACLKKVVSNLIVSSINASKGEFVPLTVSQVVEGCHELLQQAAEGKSKEELLEIVKNNTVFEGAKTLNESESDLLRELEMACDSIVNLRYTNRSLEARNQNLERQVDTMYDAVQELTTQDTAQRICARAGLWQYPSPEEEKRIENSPSDKQIIEQQLRPEKEEPER